MFDRSAWVDSGHVGDELIIASSAATRRISHSSNWWVQRR